MMKKKKTQRVFKWRSTLFFYKRCNDNYVKFKKKRKYRQGTLQHLYFSFKSRYFIFVLPHLRMVDPCPGVRVKWQQQQRERLLWESISGDPISIIQKTSPLSLSFQYYFPTSNQALKACINSGSRHGGFRTPMGGVCCQVTLTSAWHIRPRT